MFFYTFKPWTIKCKLTLLHYGSSILFSFLPAVCVTQYQTFIRFPKTKKGPLHPVSDTQQKTLSLCSKVPFCTQADAGSFKKRELVLLHDDNLASCRRATSSAPQETHLTICFTSRSLAHAGCLCIFWSAGLVFRRLLLPAQLSLDDWYSSPRWMRISL